MLNNMCVCVFNAVLLKRGASPSIAYSVSRIDKLRPAPFQAMRTSAKAVSGSADSRSPFQYVETSKTENGQGCESSLPEPRSAGQPASLHDHAPFQAMRTSAKAVSGSADSRSPFQYVETSKTENGQGCESSLPEPRSAGQPASLHDHVPTFLRNTALGTVLLDRMIWESWQPIMVDDIPWKWWPYFEKQDNSWTAGRPIALTMPDQPAFMIYKRWFEGLPPTEKLGIATFVESTQSFIEAYGADTYRRTLINLATHGKPQAIFVEVLPVSGTSGKEAGGKEAGGKEPGGKKAGGKRTRVNAGGYGNFWGEQPFCNV